MEMSGREKVITEFEHLLNEAKGNYQDFVDLTVDAGKEILAMLKEQNQRTGHWIFESQHYEAWSHTCSECGKRMTTGIGTYASYCWNCGAKMTGGEEDG